MFRLGRQVAAASRPASAGSCCSTTARRRLSEPAVAGSSTNAGAGDLPTSSTASEPATPSNQPLTYPPRASVGSLIRLPFKEGLLRYPPVPSFDPQGSGPVRLSAKEIPSPEPQAGDAAQKASLDDGPELRPQQEEGRPSREAGERTPRSEAAAPANGQPAAAPPSDEPRASVVDATAPLQGESSGTSAAEQQDAPPSEPLESEAVEEPVSAELSWPAQTSRPFTPKPQSGPIDEIAKELTRRQAAGSAFHTKDVLFALNNMHAPSAINILLSRNGNSHVDFDPRPYADNIREFAARLFRGNTSPVSTADTYAFVRYVLDSKIKNPWVLLYTVAIVWRHIRSPILLQEAIDAVREARASWPEMRAEDTFTTRPRMVQKIMTDFDSVRLYLPLDIQLSWDSLFEGVHPLPHCVRLLRYLQSDLFPDLSSTDILAFVNPARQSDMDEHPIAVVFVLETLRHAKARESSPAEASAVFDATVSLLPSLTPVWAELKGVPFDLSSVRRWLVPRAEQLTEMVFLAAEEYLAGPLGELLGTDGLQPWVESRILLGPGEDDGQDRPALTASRRKQRPTRVERARSASEPASDQSVGGDAPEAARS